MTKEETGQDLPSILLLVSEPTKRLRPQSFGFGRESSCGGGVRTSQSYPVNLGEGETSVTSLVRGKRERSHDDSPDRSEDPDSRRFLSR